jgi:hypothetical protein
LLVIEVLSPSTSRRDRVTKRIFISVKVSPNIGLRTSTLTRLSDGGQMMSVESGLWGESSGIRRGRVSR